MTDPDAPSWQAQAPDTFVARFVTTRGEFEVGVVRAWAPGDGHPLALSATQGSQAVAKRHAELPQQLVGFVRLDAT